MTYLRLCAWYLAMSFALCGYASAAPTQPSMSESELRATLTVMRAAGEKKANALYEALEKEKLSAIRFRELLTEIAVVFPYATAEVAQKSPVWGKLSQRERDSATKLGAQAKSTAIKYFDTNKTGGAASLERTKDLLIKYRDDVERNVIAVMQISNAGSQDKGKSTSVEGFRVVPGRKN